MMQIQNQHQYLTNTHGHKTHIVLPLEEYEELIHQLFDARDAAQMPQLVADARENGEQITIKALAARVGVDL